MKNKNNYVTVGLTYWYHGQHNMGMAFNRKVWEKIQSCSSGFCRFDDYNWDFSLLHVSMKCLKEPLQVMYMKGPRVFHMGECGFHKNKLECDIEEDVRKIVENLDQINPLLYSTRLTIESFNKKKRKLPNANGGWGDKRDQEMCMNMNRLDASFSINAMLQEVLKS
jgi:alpha-1,6-mannosyl-glycoprotein beta-1,2-N-acetylglucosaminyltransferase